MSNRAEDSALKAYPDDNFVSVEYADMCRSFYQEGYEQAEKELGWHSVKDRLPEENRWVFVCIDMQGVPQCVGLGYLRDGEWCDDENDNGFCVDYWMPIPELPKEEE